MASPMSLMFSRSTPESGSSSITGPAAGLKAEPSPTLDLSAREAAVDIPLRKGLKVHLLRMESVSALGIDDRDQVFEPQARMAAGR